MNPFGLGRKPKAAFEDHAAEAMVALSQAQPAAIFAPDRTLLDANQLFLDSVGYTLAEIKGKSHDLFVGEAEVADPAYAAIWEGLADGRFQTGEYARIGKGGREIFLHATYLPVRDKRGTTIRVIELAFDITRQLQFRFDNVGRLAAIDRAQGVVEFDLDGKVLAANRNYCAMMGYPETEIIGKPHRAFVDPVYAASAEYREFWERLRQGGTVAGEFQAVGNGGKPLWITASYNPVHRPGGKPYKIVEYALDASDATARKYAIGILGERLARLSAGDLSTSIPETFEGDLDKLRLAFNETTTRFREIVGRLRGTSALLKSATGQILSGADDLADRTARQAAAVEQTSAALEQLSATVGDNAKRASSASAKASSVSRTAADTNGVMREANDAMERITASSTKISNIIGLIDDIAFQTNLLALNASVEAARAGDAGKGFAVVAVEVRRLAQSAAGASAEVKALIEQSAGEVSTGSRKVAEASSKVTLMFADIQENGVLIEEITRATKEQADAISEVTLSVRQVDDMTRRNAVLVEQTNAAVEQTKRQAVELDGIVDVFVIDEKRRHGGPAVAVSPQRMPRTSQPARAGAVKR